MCRQTHEASLEVSGAVDILCLGVVLVYFLHKSFKRVAVDLGGVMSKLKRLQRLQFLGYATDHKRISVLQSLADKFTCAS